GVQTCALPISCPRACGGGHAASAGGQTPAHADGTAFSHPDYTVGSGIAPDRPHPRPRCGCDGSGRRGGAVRGLAGRTSGRITAGQELELGPAGLASSSPCPEGVNAPTRIGLSAPGYHIRAGGAAGSGGGAPNRRGGEAPQPAPGVKP